MVLELGVRRRGDMRAHLDIVRPDIVVVTPVASSYRDDHEALEVLREEIGVLCRQAAQGATPILLCGDDATVSALADQLPDAVRVGPGDLEATDAGTVLKAGATAWPVRRDAVGASGRCALSVAARVGRFLGMTDEEIGAFLSA